MLKKAAIPLLGLLIVVLAGCATSKTAGPPADVNGTWTGGSAAGAATYTVVLKQTGADVTGLSPEPGPLMGPSKALLKATASGCGKQIAMDPRPHCSSKATRSQGGFAGPR